MSLTTSPGTKCVASKAGYSHHTISLRQHELGKAGSGETNSATIPSSGEFKGVRS